MLTNPFEIKHMIRNGDTEKITIFKDKKRMYLYDTLILFDKIIDVELYQATQQLSGINLSVKLVKT